MVASVLGPLSANTTHLSSDLGSFSKGSPVGNRPTPASVKRRLMFTNRIFQGEAFYLDLRTVNGSRQRSGLEADLAFLGGHVEAFLSKEVTHVITDRNDNHGSPAALSSPAAGGSSSRGSKASPAAFSRAQALLNRSVSKQQQQQQKIKATATDPVSLAKQWGIRVTPLAKVLHIIEREKSKCDPNRRLSSSKQVQKGAVRVRKLEGAFIKVEDMSGQYRPSSKNFPSFPVIDLMDPAISHNQSPFAPRRKAAAMAKPQDASSSKYQPEKANAKPTPVAVAVKEKNHHTQPAAAKSTPTVKPPIKKVTQSGFCEACDTHYTNLKEHTQSDTHRQFASRVEHFQSLDGIISELPSLEKLRSSFLSMTISSQDKKEEPQLEIDSDEQMLVTEGIAPILKTDLNDGVLSENEKGLQTPERPTECQKPPVNIGAVREVAAVRDTSVTQHSIHVTSVMMSEQDPVDLSVTLPQLGSSVPSAQGPDPCDKKDVESLATPNGSFTSIISSAVVNTEKSQPFQSYTNSYEDISSEPQGTPSITQNNMQNVPQTEASEAVETDTHTGDDVILLTPVKLQESATIPNNVNKLVLQRDGGSSVSEKQECGATPQRLTPRNTPLKDFTPLKSNSDMRVLSESSVQAVLKELKFLNTNYGPATDAPPLLEAEPAAMECLLEGAGSESGSASSASMPELIAEATYTAPDLVDTQSNEATMQEPLSSRGSHFDVSPVKLLSQFAFTCLNEPETSNTASSKHGASSSGATEAVVLPENHTISSCNSDAVLPDSISDSKSYPTSFSNILAGMSPTTSMFRDPYSHIESILSHCSEQQQVTEYLEKTLTEEETFCSANTPVVTSHVHSCSDSQQNMVENQPMSGIVEPKPSQGSTVEQMEFSDDVSSERVENSIAQNLLARLQDQSFDSESNDEDESAPDVLLHYDGGIHEAMAGSETMTHAAKHLVDVDSVFCGESVVCDSRSQSTVPMPLDGNYQSHDSCSSVIPTMKHLVRTGEQTTMLPSKPVPSTATFLARQWTEALVAASATKTPPHVPNQEPIPASDLQCHSSSSASAITNVADINQNKFYHNAELTVNSKNDGCNEKQPMCIPQENHLTFSGLISNCDVSLDLTNNVEEPMSEASVGEDGRWSPSMILNPASLWWQTDSNPSNPNLGGASEMPKDNCEASVKPGNVKETSRTASPVKAKVVVTKVHKKSKSKSKRSDRERTDVEVVRQRSEPMVDVLTNEDEVKERKSKPHKHKSKKQKSAKTEIESPTVSKTSKSEKHKSKKSKSEVKSPSRERSKSHKLKSKTSEMSENKPRKSKKSDKHTSDGVEWGTPKLKSDPSVNSTPKSVLLPSDCNSHTVTWKVTPSRGLKLKLCKVVVTPLQAGPAGERPSHWRSGSGPTDFALNNPDMVDEERERRRRERKLEKEHRRRKLAL